MFDIAYPFYERKVVMSDKENVKSIIDDNDKSKKPKAKTLENTDKKPLSDEVKQRIAGLAVIGVITVGLCITGLVGRSGGDSIPTASVSSSVSSLADEESSVSDSASSVNSVEESSKEDESSDTEESSQPDESADESSQQETQGSQSGDASSDSEQPDAEDSSKAESSQPDKPQTAKPSTTDKPKTQPAKTDPPKTDPPKTDPPKTDPPKTDPPKTDPPAPSGGLSASCSVVGNPWEENGKKCFQISITINNGTASEKNGWTVSMTVPSGCEINNCWNGKAVINGTTLTITNDTYNNVIAAGGNISDVGLIVKSPSEFTPTASVS